MELLVQGSQRRIRSSPLVAGSSPPTVDDAGKKCLISGELMARWCAAEAASYLAMFGRALASSTGVGRGQQERGTWNFSLRQDRAASARNHDEPRVVSGRRRRNWRRSWSGARVSDVELMKGVAGRPGSSRRLCAGGHGRSATPDSKCAGIVLPCWHCSRQRQPISDELEERRAWTMAPSELTEGRRNQLYRVP